MTFKRIIQIFRNERVSKTKQSMLSSSKVLLCSTLAVILFSLVCECVDPANISVSVGQTATLPCHVEIHGNIQVVWRDRNQIPLTLGTQVVSEDRRLSVKRPYQNDWDLQITGVKLTDAGQYSCSYVVQTQDYQLVKSYNLVIQLPPTITSVSPDVTLSTGGSARLVCNASGVPTPTLKWSLQRQNEASKEVGTGGVYEIRNVQRFDAGRYECLANNGVLPPASQAVQVTVTFKPLVLIPYREIRQGLNSDTLLECLITSNPTDDIYWEKEGRRLENVSGKYRINSRKGRDDTETFLELIIYSLRTEDFNWYTCVAKNDFGIAMESAGISAWHNGTLRMLSTPKDVIAQTGQNVVIDCSVEGMTEEDRLVWWRQDSKTERYIKIFESSSNGSRVIQNAGQNPKYSIVGQYSLVIKNVAVQDEGLYECHVLGLGNYSAVLTVVLPDSTAGSECKAAQSSTPVSITVAIAVSVAGFLIIVFIIVVFAIVRHYRGQVANSKSRRHDPSTPVKTERYISFVPNT